MLGIYKRVVFMLSVANKQHTKNVDNTEFSGRIKLMYQIFRLVASSNSLLPLRKLGLVTWPSLMHIDSENPEL